MSNTCIITGTDTSVGKTIFSAMMMLALNELDQNGNSILHIACQNGLKRIAKLALRSGAEINLQNSNGNTPLHFCFGLSFGETLGTYLISKGANPF